MRKRRETLPGGWYPRDPEEILRLKESWKLPHVEPGALAALAPHAGWYFSGRLAAIAWSALAPAETLVVIGGHLGPSSPPLIAEEEGFETPFGTVEADLELGRRLVLELGASGLRLRPDTEADNTVEVQLPFLGLFAPKSRLLWLRAPAGKSALVLGAALGRAAGALGRRVAVLASSDLTHYGPDYGFTPRGSGREAEAWVREVNDRRFLDALLAWDGEEALVRAAAEGSACSAGAPAAALAFARASGAGRAEELAYSTSLERRVAPSFVGYAALAFYP